MAPGIILCLGVGLMATWLGGLQHVVGSPMIGLLLGMLIANFAPEVLVSQTKKGAGYASKMLLKAGIVLAGGTLNLRQILTVGLSSLPLIIFNIGLSLGVAFLAGRLIKVSTKTRTLVGGGTAICGGTAIATLAPIIEADEEDIAYAMTAIFLFDIFAALMWPYAALAMGLSAEQYGILGGLAISDTASVTAAAGTFDMLTGAVGDLTGGDMSIIHKLTRTTMLVVLALAVMLATAARKRGLGQSESEGVSLAASLKKAFPVFILGFLGMALVNSTIGLGGIAWGGGISLAAVCKQGYKYLIAVALTGIGYKIKLGDLFTKGARPVLLGGITWAAVALSTLGYVLVLM